MLFFRSKALKQKQKEEQEIFSCCFVAVGLWLVHCWWWFYLPLNWHLATFDGQFLVQPNSIFDIRHFHNPNSLL